MAQDNTLMLVALGGLAFFLWQRSKTDDAPVAIAAATATASPTPTGARRPRRRFENGGVTAGVPGSSPVKVKRGGIRLPYQSPPIIARTAVCTPQQPCIGYAEPVIDYYTPDDPRALA